MDLIKLEKFLAYLDLVPTVELDIDFLKVIFITI